MVDQVNFSFAVLFARQNLGLDETVHYADALSALELVLKVVEQVLD